MVRRCLSVWGGAHSHNLDDFWVQIAHIQEETKIPKKSNLLHQTIIVVPAILTFYDQIWDWMIANNTIASSENRKISPSIQKFLSLHVIDFFSEPSIRHKEWCTGINNDQVPSNGSSRQRAFWQFSSLGWSGSESDDDQYSARDHTPEMWAEWWMAGRRQQQTTADNSSDNSTVRVSIIIGWSDHQGVTTDVMMTEMQSLHHDQIYSSVNIVLIYNWNIDLDHRGHQCWAE